MNGCSVTPPTNEHIRSYPDTIKADEEEIVERDGGKAAEDKVHSEDSLYEFYFKGIYFSCYSTCLAAPRLDKLRNTAGMVQLHFSVRCSSVSTVAGKEKPLAVFHPQQHNLLYFSNQQITRTLQPEEQLELVEINLAPDFLLQYLPEGHPIFDSFRSSMGKGIAARLSNHNLPLTPKISTILHELANCPQKGYYRRLFTEAKVIELLSLQLEQCEQARASTGYQKLKQADIEKMNHAREILLSNLEQPFSLVDLAHLVGTNEYYLKKQFKQVFGNTVFGYLHTYRMEQAKNMLLEGDKKISEVAGMLGYKYPSHFTSAFKKHFGFLPQQVKP